MEDYQFGGEVEGFGLQVLGFGVNGFGCSRILGLGVRVHCEIFVNDLQRPFFLLHTCPHTH